LEIRNLGASGLRVSAIGLGCNNFGGRVDADATRKVIHKALDLGITLFDTADTYGERGGSETVMGQILGDDRKRIVLATKFGMPMDDEGVKVGGSRRYIMSEVEDSLRRLRTDWIDLYQIHAPDPRTPIEETLRALDDLIRQGKVRYIGCSNMSAEQIMEAQRVSQAKGLHRFVACQNQYNLLSRHLEAEIIPSIEAHRLSLIPYFPLAAGMLTGKYRPGAAIPAGSRMSHQHYADEFLNDECFRIVAKLQQFSVQRGRSLLELAFGWLLSKPFVGCVIAGASTPEQVRQNAAAIGWQLTAAEMTEVNRLTVKTH
jgi:aryl-alcohol dehydrogenase-like predicted oxidoreductase